MDCPHPLINAPLPTRAMRPQSAGRSDLRQAARLVGRLDALGIDRAYLVAP